MPWSELLHRYNAVQINVTTDDLYPDRIDEYLDAVKDLVKDTKEVLIFWAPGQIISDAEFNNDKFDAFRKSIPNPVLFYTGCLKSGDICFFEYESAEQWKDKDIKISISKRNKKFLSIGTKDYPQRKFVLSNIIANNLLDHGYVSYTQLGYGGLSGKYLPTEAEHINRVANVIDSYLPLPSLDNSCEWVLMPSTFPTDSYLNVITDTYYEVPDNCTFLSEKVFNAMAHGQMFVMLSPAGTLRYLKSLGYQTFGEYIDESYDDITDHYQRLLAMTNSLIKFISLPIDEIHEIYTKCFPIIMHNQNRLMNNTYWLDLCNSIDKAYREKI